MSIPLTGTGGFFTREGKFGKLFNAVNTFRDTDVGSDYDAIRAQFDSTDQNLADGIYADRDALRTSIGGGQSAIQSDCISTLIQMADDDVPLASKDKVTAMRLLITQMVGSSDTVKASVPTESVAAGTLNVGDATVVVSLKGPNGAVQEYILPEDMTILITGDATLSATARREPASLKSPMAQSDTLQWDWPKGSATNKTFNVCDSSQNAGQNLLVNSDMETFSPTNTLVKWDAEVGAYGTRILESSSIKFTGSKSLNFLGNGSELTAVHQRFNNSTSGTATVLKPNTIYAFAGKVRMDATPAAGVLEVALINSDTLAVLQDDQGVDLKKTLSLTGVSTSWVDIKSDFVTPRVLPTNAAFRIRLSTALETGKNVYMDNFAFQVMTTAYAGGPSVALFAGATNVLNGDKWTVTIGQTFGEFQKFFERIFGMKAMGLQLPSAGSPTIPDSLLT